MSRKSFYDLTFSVAPGGARKDTHYIRGTVDEISADLAAELMDGPNLYLLCWYGAELSLHVYQRGEPTTSIDLHPFLTISIDGYPDITFDGAGKPVGYDFGAPDEADAAEGSLAAKMFSDELDDFGVTVDWDRIEVPPLEGERALAGDLVQIEGDAEDGGEDERSVEQRLEGGYLRYGFNDREA